MRLDVRIARLPLQRQRSLHGLDIDFTGRTWVALVVRADDAEAPGPTAENYEVRIRVVARSAVRVPLQVRAGDRAAGQRTGPAKRPIIVALVECRPAIVRWLVAPEFPQLVEREGNAQWPQNAAKSVADGRRVCSQRPP